MVEVEVEVEANPFFLVFHINGDEHDKKRDRYSI